MDEKTLKEQTTEDNTKKEQLEGGTYEIIRNRLLKSGEVLKTKLNQLNNNRKEVFGSIETKLLANERITTEHNCVPSDMTAIGTFFLFGYNVHFGLKTDLKPSDVFSIYTYSDRHFKETSRELIDNKQFVVDFENLYKYYKNTSFTKFAIIGVYLHMVFKVGKSPNDIKTFKWLIRDGKLEYIDNRSEHEYVFPDQHEFKWKRTSRDQHQAGKHPHISIENKVFVETTEGDLTIKVENNTDSGRGIYSESVEDPDQTLDDAEFFYSIIDNLIVLKIRPYQEKRYRYFVFNIKLKEVKRIDSLEDSCVLLPDNQGIVFANGYYLQTGAFKIFDNDIKDMLFEQRVTSPNGEDYLYVFFNRASQTYVLLPYNLIEQQVSTPIICHGYSIFENGELCYFRSTNEAQRHHSIQIWQTPYVGVNYEIEATTESELYKIGNKDIVKAMAECNELLTLLQKDDSYSGLYLDLVKRTTDIIDTYYWLNNTTAFSLTEQLREIHSSASSAIDEYEKVRRIKKNTKEAVERVSAQADTLIKRAQSIIFEAIDDFVQMLAGLRTVRGEVISLKELRYVNLELVAKYDTALAEEANKISEKCINFLTSETALLPYEKKVDDIKNSIAEITKVVDANKTEENINAVAGELEMLIEIVSNLKIEDATLTARIIDNISSIYARFNQIRVALKRKRQELILVEGKAEFNAQIRLISQSIINYLDLCDVPEKTDEYLSKLMVQLEELEGKFSDFPEFIALITEKREEVYNAFESKKIDLIEIRASRANALMQSAERILKAIQNRVSRFQSVAEINGYYASDLMIEKARDIGDKLMALEETVKADDLQSKLKSVREDAIRQLKDRTELFTAGENIISFGKFQFTVNTQALGLTMLSKDGDMYYHLTGTGLYEKVTDPELEQTRAVWEQKLISENDKVYRAEYLAYKILENAKNIDRIQLVDLKETERFDYLKKFMGQRYNEGYMKGVHDNDAFNILQQLIAVQADADLLRFTSKARACAELFWVNNKDAALKKLLSAQIKGAGSIKKVFGQRGSFDNLMQQLTQEIQTFVETQQLFDAAIAEEASEYLIEEISRGDSFVIDDAAVKLYKEFTDYLARSFVDAEFTRSTQLLADNIKEKYILIYNWIEAYLAHKQQQPTIENADPKDEATNPKTQAKYIDEVAVTIYNNSYLSKNVVQVTLQTALYGMQGTHPNIDKETYAFDYNEFVVKLKAFERTEEVLYTNFVQQKSKLIENYEQEMRLNEFKPRVLSSFVRNQLIDKVYLPLIGANLAKQIGAAGSNKRTDLMGMLLLISPPGYGKTTLMEYIANRLGIIFMKINGPAIGHNVVSVDPAEAKNAAAREELKKLNLAFEMGDNVMIYLDDIQHCNPEFLQKFISLADGQRKIEGIYKGKAKTYDFRGKKVCIVMAGNPYTESGDKFKIPDMLSNRADIYNLGDIIGDSADVFNLSYIENAMTANTTLARLSTKSHKDLHAMLKIVATGSQEGVEFEASHSPEEVNEYVLVLKKMLTIRDVLLKVNQQYIYSAAQADEYRTEPQFKLQGSYRNMSKLAEKIFPIMNDQELKTLIMSHYENEAQTLTTGAESNMLKFKEMTQWLSSKEAERWEEIKHEFKKQQRQKGFGQNNQMAQILQQLEALTNELTGIKGALQK